MAVTGRPRKEIDKTQFEKLCGLQCTKEEIAGFFDVSVDTLLRFCEREYKDTFANVYKNYTGKGKIALRRYQMHLAETNASMAIFLGKQYLGQRDIPIADNENENQVLATLADSLNKLAYGK